MPVSILITADSDSPARDASSGRYHPWMCRASATRRPQMVLSSSIMARTVGDMPSRVKAPESFLVNLAVGVDSACHLWLDWFTAENGPRETDISGGQDPQRRLRTMTDATSTTQRTWTKDFNSVAHALAPHVITLDDGAQVLSMDAPANLVRLHRGLVTVGYAKGWL